MLERENDIKAVVEARKELEGHHKILHEKTLVVLQKFKDELDADLTTRYTKGEQELLDMADEGIQSHFPHNISSHPFERADRASKVCEAAGGITK